MNAAQFLITIAQRMGVDAAFSLTGGMAMHFNRAVGASSLRVLYCNHEQACVAAADGYSKMHEYQVPGLAVVTAGPGVTNTLTSLASAFHDSVPLLLLAGQVKSADINGIGVRTHGAQEVPSLKLVEPIVKDALRYGPQIDDNRLAALFASAVSGRKGPVFLEVPLDTQTMPIENAETRVHEIFREIEARQTEQRSVSRHAALEIRQACTASLRPVLFIGNGTRIAGVSRARIGALAEALGAPVLLTWPSADLFDADHELCFGCPGGLAPTYSNRVIQNADMILFLGARLDLLTTGFNPAKFGKRAERFIVDIDEAELSKLSGVANVHPVLADVRQAVAWLEGLRRNSLRREDWLSCCTRWRAEDAISETSEFGDGGSLNARNIARSFGSSLTNATLVATGSGYAIEGFARFFKPSRHNRLVYAGHSLGAMGLGLPTAIGAAAADQGTVICMEGDGGIMLNLQELLTLQANPDLKLVIGIFDNAGYESIGRSQNRAFAAEYGASARSGLGVPDFRALAAAFGFEYEKVASTKDLDHVLHQVQSGRSRLIIDIIMSHDDYRGPAIMTKFGNDGIPYSTDIEDVAWRITK
jgi:acetolactate synthase I/II/III large subunit